MNPSLRLLTLLLGLATSAAAQPTFVVTATADADDGACDAHCTLREALHAADAAGGGTVVFSGLAPGDATVVPTSPLPILDHAITLDGTTHPDGRVALDGSALAEGVGLNVQGAGCLIRGLAVYGFPEEGLFLIGGGGDGTRIEDNYVGTDLSGMEARGNKHGVALYVASSVTIAGNVIAGNREDGIRLAASTDVRIEGNRIGTAADGATPLGNTGYGVAIFSTSGVSSTVVGGTEPGAGNVIAHNGKAGVRLTGSTSHGHAVLGNTLFRNGEIDIDLNDDGPTPNDPGDGDFGPNNLQNYPEVVAVAGAGTTLTVTYAVPTAPQHAAYPLRVEFFLVEPGAEAKAWFLGADSYPVEIAEAERTVALTLPTPAPPGAVLVATATDADGHTSELSPPGPVTVQLENPVTVPQAVRLGIAVPNPTQGAVRVVLDVAEPQPVRLVLLDARGREVAVLMDGTVATGRHEVVFDAGGLPGGTYFARLRSGGAVAVRALTLVR